MRKVFKFTAFSINSIKPAPKGQRVEYWDAEVKGLGLRVGPVRKAWFLHKRARGETKAQRIGMGEYIPVDKAAGDGEITDAGSLAWAREEARRHLRTLAKGESPKEQKKHQDRARAERKAATFDAASVEFIEKYAKRRNRSWRETARILGVPEDADTPRDPKLIDYCASLRGKSMHDIGRDDVVRLLDGIVESAANGERKKMAMADHVLAALRKLMGWYQARNSRYASPIVKGLRAASPVERDRVLTRDEIAALWRAADDVGAVFGPLLRLLLLTGQRLREISEMQWSEIGADGAVLTIAASRYKGKREHVVPLSPAAQAVLATVKRISGCEFVFSTNGKTPFSGFSKAKATLDSKMLAALRQMAKERGDDPAGVELPAWRLHDLRRSSTTLMVEAGVFEFVADRVRGKKIGGVSGIYNRHSYFKEKTAALETLAAVVNRIVSPPPDNVVTLREAVQ